MKKQLAAFGSLIFTFSLFIAAIALTATFLSLEFLWVLFGFQIFSFAFAIYVLTDRTRRIETRIRWSIFITMVPFLGIASYFFFGRQYSKQVKSIYKYKNFKDFNSDSEIELKEVTSIIDKEIPEFKRAFMMGYNQQGEIIYKKSNAELFDNGSKAWIQIMRDLNSAKDYILINMYIIEDGELYRNIIKILHKKIADGVRVYLIFDFIGCYGKLTYKMQRELKNIGVNLIPFSPLPMPFLDSSANYRDHRKDFSIDGKIGYTGGANLTDEYINLNKKFGFWNDAMVRITGESVQGIEKVFASDWAFAKKRKENITDLEPMIGTIKKMDEETKSKDLVQVVSSGPNHDTPLHLDLLLNLIGSAQKRIWLSTPYFVPPMEVIRAICSAAKSGIDVRIVLPGMTDKFMLLDVSKKWTDDLYEAGVKIYSMNNVFNHTKAFLFDDTISFIGSTNIDFRALFSDQQTMLLIKSKKTNKQLENRFNQDFKVSELLNYKPSHAHNWFVRIIVNVYNIIATLL